MGSVAHTPGASSRWRFPVIWLLAVGVGLGAGVAAAGSTRHGLIFAAAVALAVALRAGFGTTFILWIPSFFVPFLGAGNIFLKGGAAAAILAFLIMWFGDRARVRDALQEAAPFLSVAFIFLAWLALTSLWATRASLSLGQLRWYGLSLFVYFGVVVTARSVRDLRRVLLAYIAGALITTLIGLAGVNAGSDGTFQHAGTQVAQTMGRVQGATGDPNVFAAALISAIALAGGVALTSRVPFARLVVLPVLAVLLLGAAESQSRGGIIAAVVSVAAAFLVLRGHRGKVAVLLAAVGLSFATWLTVGGGSLGRVTNFGDKGDGREELWRIAGQMAENHPLTGVGLQNFIPRVPDYVLSPGSLQFIHLLIEKPVVVHNTYLQFLAETGIPGLVLFATLVAMSMRAMVAAARRFDDLGHRDAATICRVAFLGTITLLVSGFFYSSAVDYKLWVLLGVGPAARSLARRASQVADVPAASAEGLDDLARVREGHAPTAPAAVFLGSLVEEPSGIRSAVDGGLLASVFTISETADLADAMSRLATSVTCEFIYVLEAGADVAPDAVGLLAGYLDRDQRLALVWGDETDAGKVRRVRRRRGILDPWIVTFLDPVPDGVLVRRSALAQVSAGPATYPGSRWTLWATLAAHGWRGRGVPVVAHVPAPDQRRERAQHAAPREARSADLAEQRRESWAASAAPLGLKIALPLLDRLPVGASLRQGLIERAARREI